MRTTHWAAPLLCFALLTAAAACETDEPDRRPGSSASEAEGPTSGPTGTPTGPPTRTNPVVVPDDAGRPEWDVVPSEGGPKRGGGMLGLVDVRSGRHDGFDRVVLELDGEGDWGWRVEYLPEPMAEGSGDRVDVHGDTHLQVALYGMGLPLDNGIPPYGDHRTRVAAPGTDGIEEIAPGGVFEGIQQAFVGIDGPERPFRTFALTNPTRVVIDVQHR